MAKFWNVFKRVLKAYSIEEKVFSIVVILFVLVFAVQGIVEVFKDPTAFLDDKAYFTEASVSEKPAIINPVYSDFSDVDRDLSSLVFSGLTRYDPVLKVVKNDMADLTILEDKKTYRFKLRDNLYWHDGEKVTSDDVYFTFHDVIQNDDFQNPILKANFLGVKITKVDQSTIDFVIKSPNSFFITNFNVGILPKHILEKIAVADLPYDNFNIRPIGSGPYKVDGELDTMPDGRQRVILKRFDKYYGDLPKIKNIRYYVYPNNQALLKEKSALDIIAKVPREILNEIKADSRFKIQKYQLPQYTAVFLNMSSPMLQKSKIRLALQKAIDKTKLLSTLEDKDPIDTPLLDLKQTDWIYKPNIEEAKGALFDSGYKLDKPTDPYRKDSKGNIFTLKMLVRTYEKGSSLEQDSEKVIGFLVDAWKAVGIKVDVVSVASGDFEQKLAARDYDMILYGESLGYNFDTFSYWHSSQANENGLNLSNFKSFAADALIEKIRGIFDQKEKETYLNQLAKEIANYVPAIFLYRPLYNFASDGKVSGFKLENLAFIADRYFSIQNWCIDCN
ncbi:hypothetical protein KBB06_00185 [Candidatus Gracilibacteria bacterium]|nr:hypothetical protein [Candidatus Gracilibacteria bacterium]